jgi:hypothetical protein
MEHKSEPNITKFWMAFGVMVAMFIAAGCFLGWFLEMIGGWFDD